MIAISRSPLRDARCMASALDPQKSALAGRRRVRCKENPGTIVIARNLFATLHELDDHSSVRATLDIHPIPLLTRDPTMLNATLTTIRDELIDTLPPGKEIP